MNRPWGIGRIAAVAAGTAIAVACALVVGPSAAAEPTPPAGPAAVDAGAAPVLTWAPCRDGFECSTAAAPLDYDRPRGAKISLSVIRLPASSPAQRIGSLLLNPGGPGGSGVDMARGIAKFLPLEVRPGLATV